MAGLARRRRVAEATVFTTLAGWQAVRPRGVVRTQSRKVLVVHLGFVSLQRGALATAVDIAAQGRSRPRRGLRRRSSSRLLLAGDVLAALDLAGQPFLPLLADLSAIPLGNGRVVPGDAPHLGVLVLLKELSPALVAAKAHALDLARLEGVHGNAPDEGDVHAQAAVDAGAR